VFGAPRFRTDSIVLSYSNLEAAKKWWIDVFACRLAKAPVYWDNQLPSDVVLKLPGSDEPTILLCSKAEVEQARISVPTPVASDIFCDNLKKAYDWLSNREIGPGPIQDGGDMQFFEVRDPEGNLIQICKEP
jgi:catechol 2,3-dioxygenase-like lactoylglutathione lyase family enzyme